MQQRKYFSLEEQSCLLRNKSIMTEQFQTIINFVPTYTMQKLNAGSVPRKARAIRARSLGRLICRS